MKPTSNCAGDVGLGRTFGVQDYCDWTVYGPQSDRVPVDT